MHFEVYGVDQPWNDFRSELIILFSTLYALFCSSFVQFKDLFLN